MAKRSKEKNNDNSSITKVNPTRSHGRGIWNGLRKVVGIRMDEKLYKAFKPFAQAVFGSVCLPVECMMAGLLSAFVKARDEGVNPGNTVSIDIGTIKIERNLKSRRRLVVEEETEARVVEGSKDRCAACGKPSYVRGIRNDDSRVFLCRQHFKVERFRLKSWRKLEEGVF